VCELDLNLNLGPKCCAVVETAIVSDWIGSRLDYNNYNQLRAIHQITTKVTKNNRIVIVVQISTQIQIQIQIQIQSAITCIYNFYKKLKSRSRIKTKLINDVDDTIIHTYTHMYVCMYVCVSTRYRYTHDMTQLRCSQCVCSKRTDQRTKRTEDSSSSSASSKHQSNFQLTALSLQCTL